MKLQELKKFLDKSKNGVVYFSLGSNTFSCDLPDEVREILITVFEQLPYNVVWKWETDELPGKPKNVFAQNWISQPALLSMIYSKFDLLLLCCCNVPNKILIYSNDKIFHFELHSNSFLLDVPSIYIS